MALTDQLVAYYKLDESSGNPLDSSGNSRTLTNTNTATFGAGKINNGGIFAAASSQYFTRADVLGTTIGGPITISAWVNFTSLPSLTNGMAIVAVNGGATTPYISYYIEYFNNLTVYELRFHRDRSFVAGVSNNYAVTLNTGTFYHIVLTYDGTNLRGYVDGALVTGPTSRTGDGTTGGVTASGVGAETIDPVGKFLDGKIDEVGVWSRELSSTEITELYNAGIGLQYPFITAAAYAAGMTTQEYLNYKAGTVGLTKQQCLQRLAGAAGIGMTSQDAALNYAGLNDRSTLQNAIKNKVGGATATDVNMTTQEAARRLG